MTILGCYEELWPSVPGMWQGAIREWVSSQREIDADRIRAYLDSGDVLLSLMSVDSDVIGGRQEIVNGSSILTDGVYVWRKDFGYYFGNYNLRLPAEFLVRVRELDYQVPVVPDDRGIELSSEVAKLLQGRQPTA